MAATIECNEDGDSQIKVTNMSLEILQNLQSTTSFQHLPYFPNYRTKHTTDKNVLEILLKIVSMLAKRYLA